MQHPKRDRNDLRAIVAIVAVAACVGGICLSAAILGPRTGATEPLPPLHSPAPSSDATTDAPSSDEPSLAYKIAVVDDDLGEERRVDVLLDEISSRYKVTRLNVADMATHCKEVLKEKGISESDLSILEHVNHIGPAGHSGKDLLAMVFTQYLLDRDRSYSPDEATQHVQQAITAAAGSGLAD